MSARGTLTMSVLLDRFSVGMGKPRHRDAVALELATLNLLQRGARYEQA